MRTIRNTRYAGKTLAIGRHGIFDFDSDGEARVPTAAADAVAGLKGFVVIEPKEESRIKDESDMDGEPPIEDVMADVPPDELYTQGLREAAEDRGISYDDFVQDRSLLDEYSRERFGRDLDRRKSARNLLDLVLEYERQAAEKQVDHG